MRDRICCIHQTPFLPWLGVAESMLVCDVFVLYDNVQFEQGGWQNRNKIKTSSGSQWITVPVRKAHLDTVLSDITISEAFQPKALLQTISQNYSKAPFFSECWSEISDVLASVPEKLEPYNAQILKSLARIIGAKCQFVWSSQLDLPAVGRSERLGHIANIVKCQYIYSGSGTKSYMDSAVLERMGCEIIWHEFESRHPVYRQQFGKLGFSPYLSMIDMLFNLGVNTSREMLLSSGQLCVQQHQASRL